ncbi:MAG: antibiotic biosynthesis monooxygenase [Desulfobacterales bacterium]|nr:antibiotic biosynthesis monooxygenase [Desulfobacterales bacterium]
MILTFVKLKALAAKRKELRQTLESIAAQTTKEKGCSDSSFYQRTEDDTDFLLIGAWESRTALDDHLQSARFSVLMGAKSLLSRPPEVVIHTVAASAVLTLPNRGTFTG